MTEAATIYTEKNDRHNAVIKVCITGIVGNIILIVIKAVVGSISGSIAVMLDALNNFGDALGQIVTIAGIKLSTKKPDKKHPYGYGRIEYLSSLIVGVIIFSAGITALKESVEKIFEGVDATYDNVTVILLVVALIGKFILGRYFIKKGNELNSVPLKASGVEATADSVLSVATIACIFVKLLLKVSIEPYVGVLLSLVIIKSAVDMLKETAGSIIGERIDYDLIKSVRSSVKRIQGVEGVYDLVLHNYGTDRYIGSVHVEVEDTLTSRDIHKLIRQITIMMESEYAIITTVGIYAANHSDPKSKEIRSEIGHICTSRKEVLGFHAFFIDYEEKLITFDIVLSFDADGERISREIIEEIKAHYEDYEVEIIVDRDFSE